MSSFTPGPIQYTCSKCGWSGEVKGRARCLECARRATATWRQANPDKHKAQKERWRSSDKGQVYNTKHKRERRRRNPETTRKAWERRALWLRSGDVTRNDLEQLYAKAQGMCAYCAQSIHAPRFNPNDPRGFDHVIPRIKGGNHTISNLVVSCGSCNARKAKEDCHV